MTKVSVIIPNYNRAAIVGETIENMLRQSLPPHEVIVVDDGSTDSSVEVIRSFGDRVTLIRQKNQGPGAARNVGLKVASGQFVQLMDSDDLASLNKLEVQTKALLLAQADIAYSPWVKVFMQSNTVTLQDVVLQQRPLPSVNNVLWHFLTGWSVVMQQCLFRTSFLRRAGTYRTDMRNWEDGDYFLRMLLMQPKVAFAAEALTLYRLDDYGKLTASGSASDSKVVDCSRFLVSAHHQSRQQLWSRSAVTHPIFLSTVWKTLLRLEATESPDEQLVQQMKAILRLYGFGRHVLARAIGLYARYLDIKKGIQQRMKGHRWPYAYQVGSLTDRQKSLIEELGFNISIAS